MPKYPYKGFTCTDNFDHYEYFKEYSEMIENEFKTTKPNCKDTKNRIFDVMGIKLTRAEKDRLHQSCSPSQLSTNDDIIQHRAEYTNQLLKLKLPITNAAKRLNIIKAKEKYKKYESKIQTYGIPQRASLALEVDEIPDLEPYKTVVFTVKYYQPFRYINEMGYAKASVLTCSHEIVLLGTNTLADLRDKLVCSNDLGFTLDLLDIKAPVGGVTGDVKDEYPSGFIFIDDCFYNDMRHEKAINYSEAIVKWAKAKDLGNFTMGEMSTTKIGDLKPKLGYPYLYMHQGDCEHILLFSDVHLLQNSEPVLSDSYPYYQSERKYRRTTCFMCNDKISKYMVSDCDRIPYKYAFFCEECVLSYNYINGEKIGTFKLYPYFDRASVSINDE